MTDIAPITENDVAIAAAIEQAHLPSLIASLVHITGDESLSRRPMERVAAPLRQMGASVETSEGRPPVRVIGNSELQPITFTPKTPSAQVKSALLLAGLSAPQIACKSKQFHSLGVRGLLE